MLAPWADKVFRKFFSYIFVSTDDTSPYSFPLWSCSDLFWFWLYVLLIEFIGHGRIFRKDFHVRNFTDEKGVGAKIHCLLDFYADISIAAFCNVGNSIDSSEPAVEAKEFVIVFSTLETESLEEGEIGLFCKGREKYARFFVRAVNADSEEAIWKKKRKSGRRFRWKER